MRRENYDERTNGQNDKYEHASQMQFAPSSTCLLVCLSACESEEDIRKQARRELNAGKVELKEYNDLVRALKGRSDDDDFIDGLADYNRRLIIALGALDVEKGFRLSQHDLRDILGRNAWGSSADS